MNRLIRALIVPIIVILTMVLLMFIGFAIHLSLVYLGISKEFVFQIWIFIVSYTFLAMMAYNYEV